MAFSLSRNQSWYDVRFLMSFFTFTLVGKCVIDIINKITKNRWNFPLFKVCEHFNITFFILLYTNNIKEMAFAYYSLCPFQISIHHTSFLQKGMPLISISYVPVYLYSNCPINFKNYFGCELILKNESYTVHLGTTSTGLKGFSCWNLSLLKAMSTLQIRFSFFK